MSEAVGLAVLPGPGRVRGGDSFASLCVVPLRAPPSRFRASLTE